MNLLQKKLYKLESVSVYDYMSGSYGDTDMEESIEVVVSTKTIPHSVMLDTLVWSSFIQTFQINGLTTYIARYLSKQGIDYSEFYENLYEWIK